MLQGTEDQVLRSQADLLCASRSGLPDTDGQLLQASRDLLCRQDLLLLSSDDLRWYCSPGCSRHPRSGREGSSSAAEG